MIGFYAGQMRPAAAPANIYRNLFHFDSGITDAAGRPSEAFGTAGVTTADFKFGPGALSAPAASYVRVDNSADAGLGASDWTLEFWVKTTANEAFGGIVAIDGIAGQDWANLAVTLPGNLWVSFSGSGWLHQNLSMGTLNDGQWHHVAICRSGNSLHRFRDGVLVGTVGAFPFTRRGVHTYIGKKPDGLNLGSLILIDEFAFSWAAKYTAGFVPPSAPFSI